MTGAQWLEHTFENALRIGDRAAYPELLGALTALRACGVLAPDVADRALTRLHERFVWPSPAGPSSPDIQDPATTAARPRDTLRAVLAPAHELAHVDGITVVLLSVELWSSATFLHMAALASRVTDALDDDFGRAMMQWPVIAANATASGAQPPTPTQPGERLMRLPLTLSDDLGTAYQSTSRSAGGTGTEWRSQWQFAPGVPAQATRLTLALQDADGSRRPCEMTLGGSP